MRTLREEFWWFVHNMIAHPLSQILTMIGWFIPPLGKLSDLVHDATVPKTHE
jgi:hypothetical protein